MSLHSYHASLELRRQDPPFSALIMAAMLKADTGNMRLLKEAFPAIERELRERYDAPGGRLGAEVDTAEAPISATITLRPAEDAVQGEPVITAAGRAVLAARGQEVRDGSLKPSAYERITGKPWVGTDEERARLEGDTA